MPRIQAIAALAIAIASSACAGVAGRAAGEAAEEATAPIVDESLEAIADPENRARIAAILASPEMRRATANLTAGAVDGVLLSLSSAESVEAMAPEMGRLARVIAQQVTLGVDDALAEVSARPTPSTGIGRILEGAEEATTTTSWLLPLALGVLAVALVIAIALLVRATQQARRERADARDRERALTLLASTLEEADRRPWGGELQQLLRTRTRGDVELERILRLRGDGATGPH